MVQCCPETAEDEVDRGPGMLVLSYIILCFSNLLLFSTVKVVYIFFLVYQPTFPKTQYNKNSAFLYFYSPCHILITASH